MYKCFIIYKYKQLNFNIIVAFFPQEEKKKPEQNQDVNFKRIIKIITMELVEWFVIVLCCVAVVAMTIVVIYLLIQKCRQDKRTNDSPDNANNDI